MSSTVGTQAVVVGAGIAGLTAACALAGRFARVVVVERDALPRGAALRAGAPQGRHAHVLLAGGQRALSDLFAGIEADFIEGGAVPLQVDLDIRRERPGYDPFPARDFGWRGYSLSRPLIEFVLRARVQQHTNVALRERCRALEAVATRDGSAVTAIHCENRAGQREKLSADLVVDASGRGALTLALLESIGRPAPPETVIDVDVGYATALFAIPPNRPDGWKGVITYPPAPHSSRGALLLPLEGERWMVTAIGRFGDKPPGDGDGFLAFIADLRTATVYDAIKHAQRLGDVARFAFPAGVRRHFERLQSFPRGLLPIGDAICCFNPVYGQGMSVAAQEARLLHQLLEKPESDPLTGLAAAFFAGVQELIETPWTMAAGLDFMYPKTRGQRPPDLEKALGFGAGLTRLAARDPVVHELTLEVLHLLKPQGVYRDPDLVRRVLEVLGEP
ncbi:MAG: FAD-dependent oxidoreductase [Vulcanimicrobiaceae bacterium]